MITPEQAGKALGVVESLVMDNLDAVVIEFRRPDPVVIGDCGCRDKLPARDKVTITIRVNGGA